MLTGVRKSFLFQQQDWVSFEQKEEELLVFMWEIKNKREWKTHKQHIPHPWWWNVPNLWAFMGSRNSKARRPSKSSLTISQTSFKLLFLLLMLCENTKTFQTFGQDPRPEPQHGRKETTFPQQVTTLSHVMPTGVARSPVAAVPSAHTSILPTPCPLSRMLDFCGVF